MKIHFPLVSLGFIALAALMILYDVKGHGWVILCAILTATQFLAQIGKDDSEEFKKQNDINDNRHNQQNHPSPG